MTKVLVAYFSATGATADVAEKLARATGADLFEIEPAQKYTPADLDWQNKQSRSSLEMNDPKSRPALAVPSPDMTGYDTIFLGFPIWWYREPAIIDTFLESTDFAGKTIIPFATSGSSDMGHTADHIQALVPGASVQSGNRFSSGIPQAQLKEWADTYLPQTHTPKVLLVNGSPHPNGCTYTALKEIADTLQKNGVDSEIFQIGTKPVAGCIACMKCRDTGKCVFDDGVNELGSRLDEFDAVVLGSPVYYAGPSGQLCAFCDRLFFTYGKKLAGKLGAAVVSCRRGGASAAFDRLNKYFGILNMHTVGSQYWNMVHGFTPDDVRQDAEGLQTMRTLAENMAWLLKCIELGRQNGLPVPGHEPVTPTHFIRS